MNTEEMSKKTYAFVSIITVVKDDFVHIQKTIESVLQQDFCDFEYLIIDGGSTDGTQETIRSYEPACHVVSESDDGLYDAMNKGVRCAQGEWIVFMNSGDVFAGPDVLSRIFARNIDADFIYSDTLFSDGTIAVCDHVKNRIIHQSLIYKKKIHDEVGNYINWNNLTAADYFFFQLAKKKRWVKTDVIISIFEKGSHSSRCAHFRQKILIDMLLGNIHWIVGMIIVLFHPFYNFSKRMLLRAKKHFSLYPNL